MSKRKKDQDNSNDEKSNFNFELFVSFLLAYN